MNLVYWYMNSDQTQILREKYNPDGSALRRDQLELLRMLQFVAEICRQHGIKWWLSSGTLLGAARHKGFIPWDDDLDIVMLREDYERFEKLMLSLEDERYVFHCMRTDVDYVNYFGKFRRRQGRVQSRSKRYRYYKWVGIGFDVFAVEKTNYLAARLAKTFYSPVQKLTAHIGVSWIRKPMIRIIEFVNTYLLHPVLRMIGRINPKEEYHYVLGTGWPRHTFYMKDTFPLATAEFEGVLFPVPKDMDAYLTNVYGDWRKLPSEQTIRKCIHCQEYINEIYGK